MVGGRASYLRLLFNGLLSLGVIVPIITFPLPSGSFLLLRLRHLRAICTAKLSDRATNAGVAWRLLRNWLPCLTTLPSAFILSRPISDSATDNFVDRRQCLQQRN